MEEILASIRRIISDDNEPGHAAAPAAHEQPVKAAPPPEPEADPEDILDLTEFAPDEPESEEHEPEPEIEPEPAPRPFFGDMDHERLVSDATAAASSAAFASVSDLLNKGRRGSFDNMPLGNAGLTLEDLAKELLRPMLSDWLDQHLPSLVERIVREEVSRLSREAF
jgi:cell pole-organizing protein PopZ